MTTLDNRPQGQEPGERTAHEKLADRFTEIRALTLFRWRVTGVATLTTVFAIVLAEAVYGSTAL